MERFAIKIDKKLKANLYKICRLCGIDNPDMVPIISEKQSDKNENACIDVDTEMEMPQKINLLIGISITKDDRMPQTMCCLCVDKINDFFEFREMCYATNAQTRKLLGLKNIKKSSAEIKPKVEVKEESIVPTSTITPASNKNANRKRKSDELALKVEAPDMLAVGPKKKLRFSVSAESCVKEETPGLTKKKLRFAGASEDSISPIASSSKKTKANIIDDAKLKKESSPPEPLPTIAVSNKKLRLAAPVQKEIASKKSKQKICKTGDQKEVDVKEEIKEEIKEEPNVITSKTPVIPPQSKLKFGCNICKERFPAKINLEAHTRTTHIPKIERYVCTACSEVLSKSFDIKNHQLWHKLSKTPYVCGCCGDTILNTYAFSRHLREHTFETPPALLVLDRECPQCHTSYATNFLYNIHICAVKTKRCAGCNRIQRNDAEYLKHSAQCAKVYLNYSKHIMPSVEALEDAVRIKNENDVEAAAEEMARISGVPLDMAPVVQLTRLSSPLIMAASQCVSMAGFEDVGSSSSKKSNKKGVSKKDLKRVDELLKSTLDALVSIKHEPEVHVDQETPCAGERSDYEDRRGTDDSAGDVDDFHRNNDSDNESEHIIKVVNSAEVTGETELGQEYIKIKQEFDEASEENSTKIGGGLKLKIKKEHGQLNSSIIEQQKSYEKRAEKRKKKKKHKDKEKDKPRLSKDVQDEQISQDSIANNNNRETNVETTVVRIKAEPQDGTESIEKSLGSVLQMRPLPEATIMTSIPMMQFQIACVSSGVEFNNGTNTGVDTHQAVPSTNHDDEPEDVKPNREELDRMLKISHISSGIAMDTDELHANQIDQNVTYNKEDCVDEDGDNYHEQSNEDERDRDDNESEPQADTQFENPDQEDDIQKDIENTSKDIAIENTETNVKNIKKITLQPKTKSNLKPKDKLLTNTSKSRNKACKSTAKPPANMPVLQISDVQSGVNLEFSTPSTSDFIPIFIKPEPQNRGYSDEQPADEAMPTQLQSTTAEEQNYISSIDFNNLTIKQEKDIEINDVQIPEKSVKSFSKLNGIKRKRKHSIIDKTMQQGDNIENRGKNEEDVEEYETGEEEEDENDDEELDEEEEEEEDEEDDEGEEEEEVEDEEEEEREYRELEYPPELVKSKTDIETEGNITKANETVVENCDRNISFVISNVVSHATAGNSTFDLSNSNNDNTNQSNVSVVHDFNKTVSSVQDHKKILHLNSLDITNRENLGDSSNNINISNDVSKTTLDIAIPGAKEPQTCLKEISSKCQAENNEAVLPMPSIQSLQENILSNETPLQIGEPFQMPPDVQISQNPEDLNSGLESHNLLSSQIIKSSNDAELQNQATISSCTIQKSEVEIFREEHRNMDDIKLKRNENSQFDQEHRLDFRNQHLSNTNENYQSCSNDLLKNYSNAHILEGQPHTSQCLQPVFEISSTVTPDVNVSSDLPNNPSTNYDCQIMLKDDQKTVRVIEGVVHQQKDASSEAYPIADVFNQSANDENESEEEDTINDELTLDTNIEERQNYQNQEVLSQRPTALALHPYLEDISSSSNSLLSNLSQTPPPPLQPLASRIDVNEFDMQIQVRQRPLTSEETENILNESNDILSRPIEVAETSAASARNLLTQPHLGQQLPTNMPTFNFDNINEIAENNNNANIEREQLQDGQQQDN